MSKGSCAAAESAEGAVCERARQSAASHRPEQGRAANRASTKLRTDLRSEGAPVYEQRELRSSGKRRRRGLRKGTAERGEPRSAIYTGTIERWE